jgi:fructose-1,6-bisphosphatase
LTDVLGEHGDINVQGENSTKLDVISNEALGSLFKCKESIGVLASEENENPDAGSSGLARSQVCVVFDPAGRFILILM